MADQSSGLSEQDLKRLQNECTKQLTKSMTKTMSDALDKLLSNQDIKKKLKGRRTETSTSDSSSSEINDIYSEIDELKQKRQNDFDKSLSFKSLFNPKNYKLAWDELRSTDNRSSLGKLAKARFGNSDDEFYEKKIKPKYDQIASLSKESADATSQSDNKPDVAPKPLDSNVGLNVDNTDALTKNPDQLAKSLDALHAQHSENQKIFNQIVEFLNPSNNKDKYSLSEDFIESRATNEQSLKTLKDIRDHIITLDDNVAKLIKKDSGLGDIIDMVTGRSSTNEESFDSRDFASIVDILGNVTRIPRRGRKVSKKNPAIPVKTPVKAAKKLPTETNNNKLKTTPNKTSESIKPREEVNKKLTTKPANEVKLEQPKTLPKESANVESQLKTSNKTSPKAVNEVRLEQPKPVEPKALSTENKIVEPKPATGKFATKTTSKGLSAVKSVARKAGVLSGLAVGAYELYDMNNTLDQYNAEIDAKVKSGELTAEQAEKEKSNVKKQTISTSVGSGAGALIGGTLGMLAGPLGSMAGAAVGQWLGEKGGELIGQWLSDDGKPNDSAPSIEQPPVQQLNQRDLQIPNNNDHLKEQADYIDELKSQLEIKKSTNNGSGGTVNVMNQNNNTNNRFDSSSWSPLSANHDSYHYYNQDNRKV